MKKEHLTVTITGADDLVSPLTMGMISAEYPFIEWGILSSWKRRGTSRYPSNEWVRRLARMAEIQPMKIAFHLCGDSASHFMTYGQLDWDFLVPGRVQINGYKAGTPENARMVMERVSYSVILQCRDVEQLPIVINDVAITRALPYVKHGVLIDPSGGRGIRTKEWPGVPPGTNIGYAGGINPDNVLYVLAEIADSRIDGDEPFWIDMETGVRTDDDRLDLNKVHKLLFEVEQFLDSEAHVRDRFQFSLAKE